MNVFIFHRDLRLVDNTALIAQTREHGPVVPVFIMPDEQILRAKNPYFSDASVQFMAASLAELGEEIAARHGELYYFRGDTVQVLDALHRRGRLASVGFNLDYTPYARRRDAAVERWCRRHGVAVCAREDYVLHSVLGGQAKKADGTPYLVYSPFRDHCYRRLAVVRPSGFRAFAFRRAEFAANSGRVPRAELGGLFRANPLLAVRGGRREGLALLRRLAQLRDYGRDRDRLAYTTSQLSAHNHFSCVSIREVWRRAAKVFGPRSAFSDELLWREFYVHLYYWVPHMLANMARPRPAPRTPLSYKPKFDRVPWRFDAGLFRRWCAGTLGVPVCDAGMRQLNATGFQHNRVRMVTSCVLTKLLLHHWGLGERYFAQRLVDYDPVQNSAGWNWQAGGVDPKQAYRIFSPEQQSRRFDPECEYIKKWVPELRDVPAADIHAWETRHGRHPGVGYPPPAFSYSDARKEWGRIMRRLQ